MLHKMINHQTELYKYHSSVSHAPSNSVHCARRSGWKQSGVGWMPSASSITSRAVVLGPTSLHDGEHDAPASSRQLQSAWLPLCLTEDGQQSHRYGCFHLSLHKIILLFIELGRSH